MKKLLAVAATLALAFSLAGCAQSSPSSESSSEPSSEPSVSSAEPSESSASASSQSAEGVNWTKAADAKEAAKGAGLEKFGVMDKVTIGDIEFTKPAFAYAGGVAQALYETGATALDVRKGASKHETPLTDRDKTEFANTWTKVVENLDVTLYGPAKGAATVIAWSDGTESYGVTFQGLGGEEVTMDTDEVSAIVKGLKEANAKEEPKEEEESQQSAETEDQQPGFDVEAAVWNNGLGELIRYYYVQGENGTGYWAVVTRGSDGNEYTTYFDANGNVIQGGVEVGDRLDENGQDVNQLAFDYGLGEVINSYPVQMADGTTVTAVVTRGSDGNEYTTYFNANGEPIEGGVEVGDMLTEGGQDVSELAYEYGLGEVINSYPVQMADGTTVTAIVTRGSDGNEYTTYVDANGNPIQGGVEVGDVVDE